MLQNLTMQALQLLDRSFRSVRTCIIVEQKLIHLSSLLWDASSSVHAYNQFPGKWMFAVAVFSCCINE